MKHLIKLSFVIIFAGIFSFSTAFAKSPSGCWQTIDDKTGQKKGLVKISSSGNRLSGKIIKTFHLKNDICTTCTGRYKNKNLRNVTILWGFKKSGKNEWRGGKILDPKNGKTYKSTAKLSGNKLYVRGYWGPFYRTQTWYRSSCSR